MTLPADSRAGGPRPPALACDHLKVTDSRDGLPDQRRRTACSPC